MEFDAPVALASQISSLNTESVEANRIVAIPVVVFVL